MASSKGFHIRQVAPDLPLTWALTEQLFWGPEANDKLKGDTNDELLKAAYDAVDWEKHYERLKGTPFYDWAVEGGGILSFGGPWHVEHAGAHPPIPEWGAMIAQGRGATFAAPHVVLFPGLAIMVTVLGFNLLGEGLQDAMEPRFQF